MKNMWLHLACMMSIQGWFPIWFGWVWIVLCSLWLYKKKKKRAILAIVFLFAFQLRLYPRLPMQPPDTQFVEIVDIKSNYVIAQSETQKMILYNVENVGFHDVLEIQGTCSQIHNTQNFNLFNFRTWANKRGIAYGCEVDKSTLITQGNRARSRLYRYLQTMEEQPRAWLLETLYGIQEDKEQDITYLVSSSGMHLSYLSHLLQVCLSLWLPSTLAQGFSLCFIALLGHVTVMKDACLRILFFRGSSFVFHKESVHDRLGVAMISLLLTFPYMVQEVSYVLPVMFRLMFLFSTRKKKSKITTIAVLIPIQFHYFNMVDVISLVCFPFLRKLYAILYGLALLYTVFPMGVIYSLAMQLTTLGTFLQRCTLPLYFHANIAFFSIWFYMLFRYLSHEPKTSKYVLLTMLTYTQLAPYLRPYMEVIMLDVGQGDSILISLPFNQGNMLIDVAGSPFKNIPKDIIVPSLHARGIISIDYVILTHDDYDHSGGLQELQELMEVKHVIQTKQEKLQLSNTMFHFLQWNQSYEDTNENSIITFFESYDISFLFMGDASKRVEQDILNQYPNLQADILKLGHHGSKTSSDLMFLHQLHPSLALISCGYQNRYGHPSKETLDALQNENIYALDTPSNGAVSIKLSNFLRFYNTASHEFGIINKGD